MTPSRAPRPGPDNQDRDEGGSAGEGVDPPEPGADLDLVSDPVPEADDPGVKRAWEEAESMEGPAPTG